MLSQPTLCGLEPGGEPATVYFSKPMQSLTKISILSFSSTDMCGSHSLPTWIQATMQKTSDHGRTSLIGCTYNTITPDAKGPLTGVGEGQDCKNQKTRNLL